VGFLGWGIHLGNFSAERGKPAKSLKFQKRNSKKEQEHCKELPPRKLHLSNLQPDSGKLRNFH